MVRWELVATMTAGGDTWIVPASEGRHFRRTWLGAWLAHRRFERGSARSLAGHPGPSMSWIIRKDRAQARREHAALEQAFRALAYQYGGTRPEQHTEPEDVVGCEAMYAVGRVLGKVGC